MNLVDCEVTEILSKPFPVGNKWFLSVKYVSWGSYSETDLCFETKEIAESIKIGYKFKA